MNIQDENRTNLGGLVTFEHPVATDSDDPQQKPVPGLDVQITKGHGILAETLSRGISPDLHNFVN